MVNFLDPANGVTTVTQADVGCVIPEMGVIGTPVIDAGSGTIYLIAETKESGNAVFRLHALDVTSGAEMPGSPVVINPPGFVPLAQKQRTSLLLTNGVIYSSWSGHCDQGTYHGWVMAHDAKTLKLLGAFNNTPGGSGASFWNGGAGPAADADGNIYVVSANGDINGLPSPGDNDEAVLKLAPTQLSVLDKFIPFNKDALNEVDLDVGSSGALLLPDGAGSAAHPHVLFTSGKEGRLYLLDRDALGGNSPGSLAAAGSFISLFFTRQGPVTGAIDDGDASATGTVVWAKSPASATIGGVAAEVEFVGLAPSFPGVAQMLRFRCSRRVSIRLSLPLRAWRATQHRW